MYRHPHSYLSLDFLIVSFLTLTPATPKTNPTHNAICFANQRCVGDR